MSIHIDISHGEMTWLVHTLPPISEDFPSFYSPNILFPTCHYSTQFYDTRLHYSFHCSMQFPYSLFFHSLLIHSVRRWLYLLLFLCMSFNFLFLQLYHFHSSLFYFLFISIFSQYPFLKLLDNSMSYYFLCLINIPQSVIAHSWGFIFMFIHMLCVCVNIFIHKQFLKWIFPKNVSHFLPTFWCTF